MSEKRLNEFIRKNAAAEVAAGAAMLAGALVIAGAKRRRSRSEHYHQLRTFQGKDMSERLTMFDFLDEQTLELNLPTRLAGKLFTASYSGGQGGLTGEELQAAFQDVDEETLLGTIQQLLDTGFAEIGPLHTGAYGFCPTSDLYEAILEGDSPALAQVFQG